MMLLRALLSSTLIILASPALAADKPSAWFCWMARNAVAVAGSEAAAEQGARARGIAEATIAKAKRCPR